MPEANTCRVRVLLRTLSTEEVQDVCLAVRQQLRARRACLFPDTSWKSTNGRAGPPSATATQVPISAARRRLPPVNVHPNFPHLPSTLRLLRPSALFPYQPPSPILAPGPQLHFGKATPVGSCHHQLTLAPERLVSRRLSFAPSDLPENRHHA